MDNIQYYLCKAYEEFGRTFTLKEYNHLALQRGWTSGHTLMYISGKSWAELMKPIAAKRNSRMVPITLQEALSYIQQTAGIAGKTPSVADYIRIAREYHFPDYRHLVRDTGCSWVQLKEMASPAHK